MGIQVIECFYCKKKVTVVSIFNTNMCLDCAIAILYPPEKKEEEDVREESQA